MSMNHAGMMAEQALMQAFALMEAGLDMEQAGFFVMMNQECQRHVRILKKKFSDPFEPLNEYIEEEKKTKAKLDACDQSSDMYDILKELLSRIDNCKSLY